MSKDIDSIAQYQLFAGSIQSPHPQPVYWISGEEQWFFDECITLAKSIVDPAFQDFNLNVLSGKDVRLSSVLDVCRTYPMMSDKRVVILRDFLASFDRKKQAEDDDEDKQQLVNELLTYIEQPNATCILVLLDAATIPANTLLGKRLRDSKQVFQVQFPRLSGKQLHHWIAQRVKTFHKGAIDEVAIELLIDISGVDLLRLSHEIEKLIQFVEKGQSISEHPILQLATQQKQALIFEVKDALFAQAFDLSLEKASTVVHTAETPLSGLLGLMGYLYAHYVLLWQIARMTEKRISKDEISKTIGKSGFYFDRLYRDAQMIPSSGYPEIFEILLDADSAAKGIGMSDPDSILQITMLKLAKVHGFKNLSAFS